MEEKNQTKLSADFNPSDTFRLQLTNEEASVITTLLPQHYSLQIQNLRKDGKIPTKKKTADQLLFLTATDLLPKPKPVVSYLPPPIPKKQPKQQTISQSLKPCLKTLQLLQNHHCSWPFLTPVDVEGMNIPEYRQIVKQPMDLSTIEAKLKNGKYQNPSQFHNDVIKIFYNSYLFNEANEDFIKVTSELEKYYYRISGEVKLTAEKVFVKPAVPSSKTQKKKKKPTTGLRQLSESMPITFEQKKELANNIHRMAKEHIKGIRSIVFENNSELNEFDIQKLSQKKLRELQKYVRSKINDMESNLRSNLIQKTEQQNLDELESSVTQQFVDEDVQ